MIFLHRCSLIKSWNMWKILDRWRVFFNFGSVTSKNRFVLRKSTSRRSSFWSATKSFLHLLCKLYFDFQVSSIVVVAHVGRHFFWFYRLVWVPFNSEILSRKCFLTSQRNFLMYSTGLPGNALECSCELPLITEIISSHWKGKQNPSCLISSLLIDVIISLQGTHHCIQIS